MTTLADRFDALMDERVGMRSLAVVRFLVGLVTVAHLWPLAAAALRGSTYHDRFHHPYVTWLPELPPTPFTALLLVGIASATSMAVGLATRITSALAFTVVAYHLALSTTHMHNNRAYLVTVLAVLAVAPTGRALSIDAWRAHRAGGSLEPTAPGWPIWLLRFQCALVYGASGVSKLVDPDWFGGTVTWGRVVAGEALMRGSAMPDWLVDAVLERSFHTVAAKLIVGTELFIACGLWWRRTRPWALAAAVIFHLSIEVSSEVQIFSYLGLAVLFVWSDPSMPLPRWLVVQTRRMEQTDPVEQVAT